MEDTLIKANSLILRTRSPYFSAMLSKEYGFKEGQQKRSSNIRVEGVPKALFSCIIQYIYSDHFYIQRHNLEFFVQLFIFADYFILPRLVEICSNYLKTFVNSSSVLTLLLLAHAHNSEQLERYCVHYIAMHQHEVLRGQTYESFKSRCHPSLFKSLIDRVNQEV